MWLPKLCLTLLMCAFGFGEGAKILGIFHFPSKSHHILGSTLLKALAKRDHEVTMISPYPLKNPPKNYHDLELTGMLDFKEDNLIDKIMKLHDAPLLTKIATVRNIMNKTNEKFLTHTVIKELLKSNKKFDLVIQCWLGNDAALVIPHFLEASTIAFSTFGSSFMTNVITANPAPTSYVSDWLSGYSDQMTFLQRVVNTLASILSELNYVLLTRPDEEALRQKYFPTAPSIQELVSNVSLVLLNSHFSIESPRPYVPSMVQIGGFHVEEPKELTGDLKSFMDSATSGVIFFSLGTNVRSADLTKNKLDAILECFASLPLKVLWKFEKYNVPNLPSNVKIGKWLPQRDILAHPNLKLFITHGGLLSKTEALYHGVPMVGIPIFGDQDGNVLDGVMKGYVVKVAFNDISAKTLTEAINEVLNNPKYRENIKQRSVVLKDQPLKPMDNAIFWVEYVLRHKGAHHLKTSALKLRWYQYYLLDVLVFLEGIILVIFVTSCFVLWKLCKCIKNMFLNVNQNSKSKQKSKVA